MKYLRLTLCVFLVCLLVGCAGLSVEDMLLAPSLSDDQAKILEALNSVEDTGIVLRYPRFGTSRAPIQFADLDGDGSDEAIAFYSGSEGNTYPGIAVLAKDSEGIWQLMSRVPGAGNEIYALNLITLDGADGVFILVEWSTASAGRRLSIYNYVNGSLNIGFEDSCVRIIIDDMDLDGSMEFCYITDQSSVDSYKIKYVDAVDEVLAVKNEYSLTVDTLSVFAVTFGKLTDGTPAIYVDEDLGEMTYTTEIFYINDSGLHNLETAAGYNISDLLSRSSKLASDAVILKDGMVAVPSDTPSGVSTPFPESWTYWYGIGTGTVDCVSVSFVNTEYLFALSLPDEWFSTALVTQQEDDNARFIVSNIESGETLFQLHVLAVGDDDSAIVSEGFWQAFTSGSYRYYMMGNCSKEDMTYIENNFRTL